MKKLTMMLLLVFALVQTAYADETVLRDPVAAVLPQRAARHAEASRLGGRVPWLDRRCAAPAGPRLRDPARRLGAAGDRTLGPALNAGQGEGWSSWPAPAKLNLFLRITGRRSDGYHDLQTVFHLLDWGDVVHVRVRNDGRVLRAGGDTAAFPESEDLLLRAARALQEATNAPLGADLYADKSIPAGGGFGGGSSDAATVLVALNQLWGTGLDQAALARIGLGLGADVPVFIFGRNAWAEGVGERLTPVELPPVK